MTMYTIPPCARFLSLAAAVVAVAALSVPAAARTLCVNPAGSGGCYKHIQDAVNAADPHDVVNVGPGTYKEGVIVGIPLSLLGAGAAVTTIDATNQPNGVLIDGFDHPGLNNVAVSGFTVENALYEGILSVSASWINISNNNVINNDSTQGLEFTGAPTGCPGQPAYETDETGDCGGAIHLNGTSYSTVSGNFVTGNADGLLISDDTAVSSGNLVTGNHFLNNPLECGIVLASHDPYGSMPPYFAPHHGVTNNIVINNVSIANGVQIGGSGLGFFSDGAGPGTVSGNFASGNWLVGNGIGGVNLHSHVGPAFFAPADNMSNNIITGNYIASNLADTADTATPGRVGINISSGGGGSPVNGTLIALNVIEDEDIAVAVNTATPAVVGIHQNDLLACTGPQCMLNIGVANVCAYDGGTSCGGVIDAKENYWGCPDGPGATGCSTINSMYSANIHVQSLAHDAVSAGHALGSGGRQRLQWSIQWHFYR
jgi:Periplasmic copper-binding protein (NosD)